MGLGLGLGLGLGSQSVGLGLGLGLGLGCCMLDRSRIARMLSKRCGVAELRVPS
mgnify:CR=1 FL=1